MDFNTFLPRCKTIVACHMNNVGDKRQVGVIAEEVFIVWYSKTLQNAKAILGVPGSPKLFEITYNGVKGEAYMDEYDKVSNQVIKM